MKPKVKNLRIFGCPIYTHVPKKKRTKLEPSRKNGNFVRYNDTLKAYMIYILRQRQIQVTHNVTFDEDVTFNRSKGTHMEIDSEEKEVLKDKGTNPSSLVVHPLDYQEELVDPTELVDPPRDVLVIRKRPTCLHDTL